MSDDAPDRLRELGKQLPFDKPDAERREALRSALLVAATQSNPSTARKRWLLVGGGFAAGALAAAAIAIVVVAPGDTTTPTSARPREAHARIEAPSTANLEHTVTASAIGIDEVVRVRAGVVRVAVPVVRDGDRVRMKTADAEIEGTGVYEVAVVDDKLERVTVTEGRAQLTVRVSGEHRQIVLAQGQTWRPTIVTADLELPAPLPIPDLNPTPPPSAPLTTPAKTPSTTKPSTATDQPARVIDEPPPSTPREDTHATERTTPSMPAVTSLEIKSTKSATEQHFQTGWAYLRAGKAREAAVELGIAADADASDPLAADARYFQAVALVRAGDRTAAERVLVAFLDRAPKSLRRGRAAVLLGKLLRDRGDNKSARAWFESALGDADPAIAAAARAHLDSLR